MGAAAPCAAVPAALARPDRLAPCQRRLGQRGQPPGGQATGPNPTDRGKLGSKRHVIVDGRGAPLALRVSGANRHDSMLFEELLDALSPVGGLPGRPRSRPDKVHADKGYDYPKCRHALAQRGVAARIARRGMDSSERLGRHRWVVERTHACVRRVRQAPNPLRAPARHPFGAPAAGLLQHLLALRRKVLSAALINTVIKHST